MRRITQDDIAIEFEKHYGSRVLWETGKHGTFWCWDGKSWIPGDDADKEISNLLIGLIRKKKAAHLLNDRETKGIKSLIKYRVNRIKPEEWDSDPWVLNTPEGIVDLKAGKLLPADKNRHCTKRTLVAPSTDVNCPLWMQFLQDITGDDPVMIDYLQRIAGYVLTGMTKEQCFFVLYGNGANGSRTMRLRNATRTAVVCWRDSFSNASRVAEFNSIDGATRMSGHPIV